MKQVPKRQVSVQLVGPDELKLNTAKQVYQPNDYQVLCEVEATGLCYSDLKLLKQFDKHVRKTKIVAPRYQEALKEYPAYKIDTQPSVPGHEAVVRALKVGKNVTTVETGKRYLIQPDLRWLKTETSNGSFGYCIEGALQQYCLVDERLFTSPEGASMLIEAPEDKSAAASALCEPWACVENAYIATERTTLTDGGRMLVVVDEGLEDKATLEGLGGSPATVDIVGKEINLATDAKAACFKSVDQLDGQYDDIVYFGSDADVAEKLFDRTANGGLLMFVLCGGKFQQNIKVPVGRTHYGGIRFCGTVGADPAEAMAVIPSSGEIRENDVLNVVGAGGPMGVMHVIRNICQSGSGISVTAGDIDENRLNQLANVAKPLADARGIEYRTYNSSKGQKGGPADYISIMAPIVELVIDAVERASVGGIINIFAGIAVTVYAAIDLDGYIEKKLYFIGTSGSTVEDAFTVLDKVKAGSLDTNLSVAAVSGLEGAIEGIRAVENQKIAGKIVVYPRCKGLGLTLLEDIGKLYPDVAEKLKGGCWTAEAEKALLKKFETKVSPETKIVELAPNKGKAAELKAIS